MPSSVLLFNKVFSVADPRLADKAVLHLGDQEKGKPGGLQWDKKKNNPNTIGLLLFCFCLFTQIDVFTLARTTGQSHSWSLRKDQKTVKPKAVDCKRLPSALC